MTTENKALQLIKNMPPEWRRAISISLRQRSTANIIAAARVDPNIFIEYALRMEGDQAMKQSWYHKRWQYKMMGHWGSRVLLQGFRGCGKSTQLTASIAHKIGRLGEPLDVRIKVISCIETNAMRTLEQIARMVVHNKKYQAIFPHVKPSAPWSSSRLGFVGRQTRDANLEAWTIFSQGIGGSADQLVFDDIVSYNNAIEQPNLQTKLKHTFYQTWLPILRMLKGVPYGNQAIYLATPWTTSDLTADLARSPGWMENQEFIPVYNALGEPNWPEQMNRRSINLRRLEMDVQSPFHFRCQMLLDPLDPSMTIFNKDTLEAGFNTGKGLGWVWDSDEYKEYVRGGTIVIGVDLAISGGSTASWSVIWVGSIDANNILWPVEIIRERMLPQKTVGYIEAFNDKYHPAVVVVETNNFQRMIFSMLKDSSSNIPVRPMVTGINKAKPEIGVPSVAVSMANGLIGIPLRQPPDHDPMCDCDLCMAHSPGCRCSLCLWIEEMTKYGIKFYDDTVMAMWFAWHAGRVVTSSSQEIKEWRYLSAGMVDNLAELAHCGIDDCGGDLWPEEQDGKLVWACGTCGNVVAIPGTNVLADLDPNAEADDFTLLLRHYLAKD